MTSTIDPAIRLFLNGHLPPARSAAWKEWQRACLAFGDKAPPAFLEVLENGSEGEQIAALLGLREFGYEAFAEGYEKEYFYRVRSPGAADWQIIRPRITPAPYPWADQP